jgi:hypothetical protein
MRSITFEYDSPFWHLLAIRAFERGEATLPAMFDALTQRAGELELPIAFGDRKSVSWAMICQLFLLYNTRIPDLDRKGYGRMVAAFKRLFTPGKFVSVGMKRIVANVTYPSSSHRTMKESVADTFLANGLHVTDKYDGTAWDEIILNKSFADPVMMSLCDQVVTPPADLWDEVHALYADNRPGFLSRMTFNMRNWLVS